MTDWFLTLVPTLESLGTLGYWFLFAITFAETFVVVGMFIPGTVTLIVMGGLAANGFYEWQYLAPFAIAGAILGDATSFEIGRRGRHHLERWPFLQRSIARGQEFFLRHQGKSVFLGRFVGPVRPVIPFVAGVMHMLRTSFFAYNIASAFGWCGTYLIVGTLFGHMWKRALLWTSAGMGVFVTSVLLLFVILGMWRWYRHRSS